MTEYSLTVGENSELEDLIYSPVTEDVSDREYIELSRDIAGNRDRVFEYFSKKLEEDEEVALSSESVFNAILEQTKTEAPEENLDYERI